MSKTETEVPDIFKGFVTETYDDGELVDSHGEIAARKDPDWPQFVDESADDDDGDEGEGEEDEADLDDLIAEGEDDDGDDDEDLADDDDGAEDDDGDDGEPDADAADDDADRDDKSKKRRKKSAGKRIAEITAEKHAERERAEKAERELAALKAGKETSAPDTTASEETTEEADLSDLSKPDPSDLKKYEFGEIDAQYMQDIAEYNAEVAFRKREHKAKVEAKKNEAAQAQAAQVEQLEKNFLDNVLTPGLEDIDDFEAVVIEGGKAGKYRLSPTLVSLISESENGAKIMYHFASNPDEAQKVASMSVERQAAYFGRVEARFDTSNADDGKNKGRTKPTRAPKPGKRRPRGSGKGARTNPATTDFASFEKMVRSKG